jgi:glycosyltransferase involved in cell wall biosynthesis
MHVTIIDGDVSYPPNSGKRLRTLRLMLPLALRHRITYIARSESLAKDAAAADFLQSQGITPILVEAPLPVKSGAAFYARLAGNLLSPLPYSVASHTHDAVREAVARHAAAAPVDLWQLEWQGYAYAVEGQTAPVVVQAHNVDALIWRRLAETEPGRVRRAYVSNQQRKIEAFERSALWRATRIVAVSEDDARLAEGLYGPLPIDVVDNGVDAAAYAGVQPTARSRQILFLGALDWRPNLDALELLLDRIFPLLRAIAPDARLAIVGRSPPDWLSRRARGTEGVTLHADVPDVRLYLAQSAAMAVPLRIGGGSRLKILESLAAGLPVVSSTVGAEGLQLMAGEHITIADEPEAMAHALARCLAEPAAALAQAERGRRLVASRYDWEILADRLDSVWQRAVSEAADVCSGT